MYRTCIYLIFSTLFSGFTPLLVPVRSMLSQDLNSRYGAVQKIDCEGENEKVNLYFEGEKIDFEYTTLGLVEVKGYENTRNETIIERLKDEACLQWANTVILSTRVEFIGMRKFASSY